MEIVFSTYARRYGSLHVGRVEWHSHASQLLGRIAADRTGTVNAWVNDDKCATEGNENENILSHALDLF